MKNNWTKKQVEQLKTLRTEGKTCREIAKILDRTPKAVEQAAARNHLPAVEKPKLTPQDVFWREECHKLQKQVEKLTKGHTAVDVLVDEAVTLAPQSYSPSPTALLNITKGESSPQSAVLLLSDTHVGAVVRPNQTLNFGRYDFPTFLRRLKRLEDSVFSIMQDHTTTPISELVLPMLGDMIDGALTHSAEVGQVNTLFSQFYGAGHAIAQFLRNLSSLAPAIRVFTCVGNHPRWGTQKKMPTKNRFSNLDQFLYAYIAALVRDIPKIKIELNSQPMAEFQVQGFNFLAAHGDVLRGGDKALGIPAHAIGRAVSATAQLRAKTSRMPVNFYCYGHFHRSMELPHSLGQIVCNGGFPGVDEFGLAENFSAVPPIQKFFFVHPKFGRSACYDLDLSFAKTEGIPYEIPGEFSLI